MLLAELAGCIGERKTGMACLVIFIPPASDESDSFNTTLLHLCKEDWRLEE